MQNNKNPNIFPIVSYMFHIFIYLECVGYKRDFREQLLKKKKERERDISCCQGTDIGIKQALKNNYKFIISATRSIRVT